LLASISLGNGSQKQIGLARSRRSLNYSEPLLIAYVLE
jgi:hypothetical protein